MRKLYAALVAAALMLALQAAAHAAGPRVAVAGADENNGPVVPEAIEAYDSEEASGSPENPVESPSGDASKEGRMDAGARKRFAIGVGAAISSSPYRGADSGEPMALPFISYFGDRLQVIGPFVQYEISGGRRYSIRLVASPKFGAYDEDDSRFLDGMGDREHTAMAGAALSFRAAGFKAEAKYEHDALGETGGGEGSLSIGRRFNAGFADVEPSAGLKWISARNALYDYGVSKDQARPWRPRYEPGDAVNPVFGLALNRRLGESVGLMVMGRYELLADELRDSPIIEGHGVTSILASVNYFF